jgi:hypothetical protein
VHVGCRAAPRALLKRPDLTGSEAALYHGCMDELHTITVTFTAHELDFLRLNTPPSWSLADTIRALALDGDDESQT